MKAANILVVTGIAVTLLLASTPSIAQMEEGSLSTGSASASLGTETLPLGPDSDGVDGSTDPVTDTAPSGMGDVFFGVANSILAVPSPAPELSNPNG